MNSASMSSNAYAFDSSFLIHSSSADMAASSDAAGGDLFFSDPFPFPFFNPTNDVVHHQIPDNQTPYQQTLDETASSSLDAFSSSFFSFSPPSTHLENLNLYQNLSTGTNLGTTEFGRNFSALDGFKVKSEELQMGADNYNGNNQNFVPHHHSYNGSENVNKSIQRSYSSNCFDGKPGFLFQPHYDTLIDSSNFQGQAMNSPENSQVRRVCSTGDLQNMESTQTKEGSFLEEANFKVGRYSAEERKEKISKYRAKRSQRNFNKTIKYACRKTLADNRPRIRGRFARNEETGENSKGLCSTRNEEDDEFWFEFEGLHEEQEQMMAMRMRGGQYMNSFGDPQFQYRSF